jgi:serine/threonine protein phosphatase PrpC
MFGKTNSGMVRANNEDSIITRPDLGLAVLADGMGGHQAGEVASAMAIDLVNQFFENAAQRTGKLDYRDIVSDSITLANSAIYELSRTKPECAGMGSTVVVTYFDTKKVYIGHVGDSRLYRFRDGSLSQVTEDHSLVQELVSRGLMTKDEAIESTNKNLVTRALGIEESVNVEVGEDTWQKGDVYLLCSDGLNDVLRDDQISGILSDKAGNLEATVDKLINTVNENGGPDNVSIILVQPEAG